MSEIIQLTLDFYIRMETGCAFTDKIRNLILLRDDDTCQQCGSKGKTTTYYRSDIRRQMVRSTLEIHHIDRNRNNNHLDNLITLCISCHKRLHAKSDEKLRIEKVRKENIIDGLYCLLIIE